MAYVDGFLLPLPKRKLQAYRRIAKAAGRIWLKYGALEYRECAGDSFTSEWGGKTHKSLFPKTVRAKPGETVVFSWIVFKSKADRDRVNARVMKDRRMAKMMAIPMPFDMKRMAYAGFKVVVDL
jgi:uncharacterized protein YbaA (DUF1428 family)